MKLIIMLFFYSSMAFAFLDPETIKMKFQNQDFNDFKEVQTVMGPIEVFHQNKDNQKRSISSFANFKQRTDYRYRDTAVKRQFGGTCSTFGLAASMENALYEINPVDLSERHLWNKYRKYSSEKAVKTALKKGAITDEKYWPMNRFFPKIGYKKNARSYLLEAPYIDDDVTQAVSALSEGRPVYIGLKVTKAMGDCNAVLDPESIGSGGGHAVSLVGYELDENIPGGGYFILKNSWSKDCGDNGYQYMPFNYCAREDLYCIMWDIKAVAQK